MEKYYYHVTSKENARKILKEGLKANEHGDIFLFENKSYTWHGTAKNKKGKLVVGIVAYYVADSIVQNQVGLDKNVMLEISAEGITGELVQDEVAEISAKCQWIAKQNLIEAKYISPYSIVRPRRFGKLVEEWRELTDEDIKIMGYGE